MFDSTYSLNTRCECDWYSETEVFFVRTVESVNRGFFGAK